MWPWHSILLFEMHTNQTHFNQIFKTGGESLKNIMGSIQSQCSHTSHVTGHAYSICILCTANKLNPRGNESVVACLDDEGFWFFIYMVLEPTCCVNIYITQVTFAHWPFMLPNRLTSLNTLLNPVSTSSCRLYLNLCVRRDAKPAWNDYICVFALQNLRKLCAILNAMLSILNIQTQRHEP